MNETLLFRRSDVGKLLGLKECIDAVEAAFKAYGEGEVQPPGILGVPTDGGGFHIKAGIMDLDRPYFVAKTNANFPGNRSIGLPTIQGLVVVFDAVDGRLLAVMDSIEITIIRTGAATAVAAKYLARDKARTMLVCGCGSQGRISIEAIMKVMPLEKIFAYDIDTERARNFADTFSNEFDIEITAVDDLRDAAPLSEIIVTCTTATRSFLHRENVSPGTFIAAVGADSEEKQELEPELLQAAKIVTDITEQCMAIGDLHHAIKGGFVTRGDVYAELGEIVAGKKTGRKSDAEIIVFDSTGMALQDVAAAAIVYERAVESENTIGRIDFNS